ncbi:hypothetical protein BCIN_15g01650 [Botrytis cinerea B05.10]|uniref:Uncharacterized protein n=3 Tax=Botryotinia fuckeliana TaxID=40559 RepID=A0A384K4M6_BOTFB|nr:hypothetical protein BCIN_15g01650 [Botrytis cinerea B05.10]ATZ57604.1 hypothetical protein BCIN_15g01650 [Botrytis cinerea B05.10]EMR81359.1 hypothetical protein BcDW1_10038 [Botrytis cinerea BcDW1]CCD47433.1 hypothetical protein BofuT4P2000064001 [Botrytis cinerea T4]
MSTTISTPRAEQLLAPLLASLPAASVSPQPPTALLPLLSPILRQRVQILSSTSDEPWLPLLCYDDSNVSKLQQVIRNDRLEAHPVSGEVEVDWETEVEIQYRRLDEETLQALVVLRDLSLSVQIVWCVGDELGGGDGWRIGEVGAYESETQEEWGKKDIASAESFFTSGSSKTSTQKNGSLSNVSKAAKDSEAENDDDDDYWAQYDNTPARTPAPKHSPAPQSMQNISKSADDEDSYYAQYADVQPAMDSHDPDEAAQNGTVETSLGQDDQITSTLQQNLQHHASSHEVKPWSESSSGIINGGEYVEVVQPRPGSRTSSSASETVAKLEKRAHAREQSEVGIKQHISTSVKSLYRLAKVAGIERSEFDRLIRTELDCLSLMDEDEDDQ